MDNWYDGPKKCIAINMWSPKWYHDGIIHIDIPAVAKKCSEAGADIVYMWQGWSQDHFGRAYYPTRKGPWHPNLKPGSDHMQEFVEALHQYQIKVIAYYSFHDVEVWQREADWHQVDIEGKDDGYIGSEFGSLCPNSPYHEYVVARQAELAELYDIDGICLLDGASFNKTVPACYCKYCQEKYKSRFGRPIPISNGGWTEEWERYVNWKHDCLTELYDDLKAACRRFKPGIPITHLAFGNRGDYEAYNGMNYEQVASTDTFTNSIASWNDNSSPTQVSRNPGCIWMSGMLTRYLRAVSGKSAHTHIGRFMYNREYQSAPEHEIDVAVSSIVAAGGSPSIADNLYPDGRLDEVAYEMITSIYRKLSQKDEYLGYDHELEFAALFYSKDSSDCSNILYPGTNMYAKSFQGAYKFLIESHIPFQVIADQGLTPANIKKYKLLILPSAVVLSDEQVDTVREYVKKGGRLLATANTSIMGKSARQRSNFGLADVFGADYVNPSNYSISYIDVVDPNLAKGIETREYAICRGIQIKTKMHETAQAGAYLIQPATEPVRGLRMVTYAMDVHPCYQTQYPAVIMNSYGKGKSIYLTSDASAVYGTYGYAGIRNLLRNSIDCLVGSDFPVTLEAPISVELGVFQKGKSMRIHLTNYAFEGLNMLGSEGGIIAEKGIPSGEMTLRVKCDPLNIEKVMLASNRSMLEFTKEEDGLVIKVPSIETHDIVVLEFSEII